MPNKHKRSNKAVSSHIHHQRQHPYRKTDDLFVHRETLECATSTLNPCIPCAYKVAAFDIALDTDLTSAVPNTRPELCPRYNLTVGGSGRSSYYGYQRGMSVLTVGDGDFTFSLAVARILCSRSQTKTQRRKKKKSVMAETSTSTSTSTPAVVATSYESLQTLKAVYPSINETIEELERLGCKVFYNVDATDLAGTLPHPTSKGGNSDEGDLLLYDRIAWNFPCTAEKNGQDGQNQQMADNRRLIKTFVKQCERYLRPNHGEIHLLHKTKPPYDQWGIERVAVDDELWSTDKGEGNGQSAYSSCPFEYKGRMVFDRCLLPPYTPRKALHKKSFTCHDACLYIFGWRSKLLDDDEEELKDNLDFGATITLEKHNKTNEISKDHSTRINNNDSNIKSSESVNIIKVTKEMIEEIRSIHLREGSQRDRKKRRILKKT